MAGETALRVAAERGRGIGLAEHQRIRPGRLGVERALTLAVALLTRHGFEPVRHATGCVRLHSCPFHPLAATARELVCGINHRFLAGVLDGLGAASVGVRGARTGDRSVLRRVSPSLPTAASGTRARGEDSWDG